MHGRDEMHTKFWLENMKGRDHMEDLGIDGNLILWWILAIWCEKGWTVCTWLRIEKIGGLLWTC